LSYNPAVGENACNEQNAIQYNKTIYNVLCTWSARGAKFEARAVARGKDGEVGLREGTGK